MNKKADYTTLKTVFGLLIAAILVILLWNIMSHLLLPKEEGSTTNFFNTLVDEITTLQNNEEKQVLFSISSEYIIIAFNKTPDYIGGFGKICNGYSFIERITKPSNCEQDKGCLCLCKATTKLSTEDCETENGGICYPFDYDVIDDKNKCGYFILAGEASKYLKIKKQDNIIVINKE